MLNKREYIKNLYGVFNSTPLKTNKKLSFMLYHFNVLNIMSSLKKKHFEKFNKIVIIFKPWNKNKKSLIEYRFLISNFHSKNETNSNG